MPSTPSERRKLALDRPPVPDADEREIADLLSSVAGSARAVGLDITLFRQKNETYSNFYANVPVEMTMRGTYHELAQFLDRVRQLDRIVNAFVSST